MEVSAINFTGKSFKISYFNNCGGRKYNSPNIINKTFEKARIGKYTTGKAHTPQDRISQALESNNRQEAKRAIEEIINNPSINLYM